MTQFVLYLVFLNDVAFHEIYRNDINFDHTRLHIYCELLNAVLCILCLPHTIREYEYSFFPVFASTSLVQNL